MRRTFLLSASILAIVAAGLGCSAGRDFGDGCSVTTDCQPELVCFMQRCDHPGACSGAGGVCTKQEDCCGNGLLACERGKCVVESSMCIAAGGTCTDSKSCCGALTCQNARCGTAPTCGTTSAACVTSATCCSGLVCSRFGLACRTALSLVLGEPCESNAQCKSGRCEGYCTKTCSSNAQCTDVTYCIPTNAGNLCVPWCGTGSNTRCSVYTGSTCQAADDVDGLIKPVCLWK